eukprot:7065927-Lingulodinium_polyedra.AAC.1
MVNFGPAPPASPDRIALGCSVVWQEGRRSGGGGQGMACCIGATEAPAVTAGECDRGIPDAVG